MPMASPNPVGSISNSAGRTNSTKATVAAASAPVASCIRDLGLGLLEFILGHVLVVAGAADIVNGSAGIE